MSSELNTERPAPLRWEFFPLDSLYSQHEGTHGHFAYMRKRGETYAENMLPKAPPAAVRARAVITADGGGFVKFYTARPLTSKKGRPSAPRSGVMK